MCVERRELCGARDVSVCLCVCRETMGVWRERRVWVSVLVRIWVCVCVCVWVCRDWVVCVEGEMGVWCVCSETVYVFGGEKG